jgi:hypothetical protein
MGGEGKHSAGETGAISGVIQVPEYYDRSLLPRDAAFIPGNLVRRVDKQMQDADSVAVLPLSRPLSIPNK